MTRFVYVLPAGRLRWEVRVADESRYAIALPTKPLYYRRKAHALIAARAIAIVVGGEVQEHGRDGVIQEADSYGNDPPETRG